MTTPGNLICSKCGYANVPGRPVLRLVRHVPRVEACEAPPSTRHPDPGPGWTPGRRPDPSTAASRDPPPAPRPGHAVTPGRARPAPPRPLPRLRDRQPARPDVLPVVRHRSSPTPGGSTRRPPEQIAAAVTPTAAGRPGRRAGTTPSDEEDGSRAAVVEVADRPVRAGRASWASAVIAGYPLLRSGAATGASPGARRQRVGPVRADRVRRGRAHGVDAAGGDRARSS